MAELSLADLGQRAPASGFSLNDLTDAIMRNPQIQQMILQDYQQSPNDRVANSFSDLTDPFAVAAQRTRQSVMPVGGRKEGMATRVLENVVPSTLESLKDIVTLPGRAMEQGITTDEAIPWASQVGMGMVGSPMTPANALGSSAKGIRAYHGSPHDFERFDISKIGTGEGAQSYGHGLYFAQNEATAKAYRDNLGVYPAVNKMSFNPDGTPNRAGQAASELHAGYSADEIAGHLRVLDPKASPEQIQQWISEGGSKLADVEKSSGRMYEVNINAKPEQMLDWDKPLAQQPAPIQQLAKESDLIDLSQLIPNASHRPLSGREVYEGIGLDHTRKGTGQNLLQRMFSTPTGEKADRVASDVLREAGIPGIKYLDQGSRRMSDADIHKAIASKGDDLNYLQKMGGGDKFAIGNLEDEIQILRQNLNKPPQTSNYVMFDDKLIDILRKYGIAGLSMLPPAMAADVRERLNR